MEHALAASLKISKQKPKHIPEQTALQSIDPNIFTI